MFSLYPLKSWDIHFTQNILDEISKSISKNIVIPQKWVLNIVFVDAESIQNLNKKYRNKDEVTDVLSFHYFDDFSFLSENDVAGEIVLHQDKIISQGQEYGLWTEHEFYKLVIHSMLHILGFDHETEQEYEEMKDWEELIWREVFGENINR